MDEALAAVEMATRGWLPVTEEPEAAQTRHEGDAKVALLQPLGLVAGNPRLPDRPNGPPMTPCSTKLPSAGGGLVNPLYISTDDDPAKSCDGR
jgi:hypothetical protein